MNKPSTQNDAYINRKKLKFHEIKTIKLISKKLKNSKSFLDIGCANGNFIFNLQKKNNNIKYYGVDISKKLLNIAKTNNTNDNIYFEKANIDYYKPNKKFDIVNASGMLTNYEDFKIPLKKWIKLVKKDGILIIFGCFNSSNIDTITKMRNNYNNSGWENGLTLYSITTIGKYIEKLGLSYKFLKFNLPIDIKKSPNPIRSYTVKTNKNKRIILTGANIVNEFYHLVIKVN